MKIRSFGAVMMLMITAALANSQSAPSARQKQSTNAQLVGVWRGHFDNLPGIDMVITDEGGQLTGAILFYLHVRSDVNHPYTSTPGLPEPMLNPRIDGTTLTFDVSHRRALPPRTLSDPPMPFHLKLIGPNEAEISNDHEGPALQMERSDY
jgi:hypothetical protein